MGERTIKERGSGRHEMTIGDEFNFFNIAGGKETRKQKCEVRAKKILE